ncbi:hypothetical protein B0T26DRAFT_735685 [Lasiosphaeria miniovina]|uniref:Uncharacterized protein n=1 Tax=Lasiosphaeria miniovina TaxID=1954250 RepID=A0AA39ZR61_9PEZI|nr:uncharacterized protein B0T26DRAFT_735685 [Lasiosphaeria miniovina]KAK0702058.1 hypothetical protein B0T26DRAFT_735685 [Lasiosphaeria miniovina]
MLIVTIPTQLHEQLHLGLYNLGRDNIVRMGRGDSWSTIGSTTYRARGHRNGDEGEGDSTGGPEPQREHLGAWPTLVIEAGHSQSLEALRGGMKWWFGVSDHQVKIVLLTKFDTQQMAAVIEKWVEIQAPARQGATTTRAAAQLRPDCDQIITITQNPGTNRDNPTSYTVTRGALRLEFDLLFLQQPQPGSAEGDVIIDIPDLQRWAARLWRLVP